jgi:hypothetical protein
MKIINIPKKAKVARHVRTTFSTIEDKILGTQDQKAPK